MGIQKDVHSTMCKNWTESQTDREIYKEMDRKPERNSAVWCKIDRWTEKGKIENKCTHMDRHTKAQSDCVHTDRQTDRQTYRNLDKH